MAAHLDSEIMVMDEVLAVGDMKFQQKCLGRMGDAANSEGRTVLYVSHNMNTIRQLCKRCIVMDHGRIIFDGDTETAIGIYSDCSVDKEYEKNYESYVRPEWLTRDELRVMSAKFLNCNGTLVRGSKLPIYFQFKFDKPLENINLRYELITKDNVPIATAVALNLPLTVQSEPQDMVLEFSVDGLIAGEYKGYYTFFTRNEFGTNRDIDCIPSINLIIDDKDTVNHIDWHASRWGYIQLPTPRYGGDIN